MNKIANTEVEINIFNLLKKLWKKKFLIIFVAIAFATAGLFYRLFIVTPQYTSSTRIYVSKPTLLIIVLLYKIYKQGVFLQMTIRRLLRLLTF